MKKGVAQTAQVALGAWGITLRYVGALTIGLVAAGMILFFFRAMPLGGTTIAFVDGLAANRTDAPAPRIEPSTLPFGRPIGPTFSLTELDNHPDRMHAALFSSPYYTLKHEPIEAAYVPPFRELINIYVMRQAVDDNFTVRVIDIRTNSLLERYTLEDVRAEHYAGANTDWKRVDELRAGVSGRLVAKYRNRGIPNDAITVKWGRVDQVYDARRRETPFIEYEIRLSRMLGMSLLATEIGTVETFNDDRLVSSVGARGRYQMMPYLLRRNKIHTYTLPADRGAPVTIREEWHPLLTMEPSFILLKAYSNAVGHEIPGISAYHTGPFNIFKIYQKYLEAPGTRYTPASTVIDAYLWALTEGYGEVSHDTGFRTYSRNYVPSAYGALRGTESTPIDTSRTLRVERVQLSDGVEIPLSALLQRLAAVDSLDWGTTAADTSLYERFRTLNPHFDLPVALPGHVVPPDGEVLLTAWHAEGPVRFFLPGGSVSRLAGQGWALFEESRVFRFDRDAFWVSDPSEITVWDEQYAALVDDIAHFGFTEENKNQLELLERRFVTLAEERPTYYRQIQRDIISQHLDLWKTGLWQDLSATALAAGRRFHDDAVPADPLSISARVVFTTDTSEP